MNKALIPKVHTTVADRAMQVFGAMGLTPDTPLADIYTGGRCLRFVDGPDEVHLQAIARMGIKESQANLGSRGSDRVAAITANFYSLSAAARAA